MKRLGRFLILTCLILGVAAAAGCSDEAVEEDNAVIARSALDSDEMIQSLLDRSGTLIGESNIIRELVCDILPGNICVISYDITLNRLTVEYGPTEEAEANPEDEEAAERLNPEEFAEYWNLQTTQDIVFYNTSALFALIPNLESVQYLVEGYGLPTFTISRENMENFYGYSLGEIDGVSVWKTKITNVFLDDLKIQEFFKEYPLKSKSASDKDDSADQSEDNIKDAADILANEEAQQPEEPEVIIPDEVQ